MKITIEQDGKDKHVHGVSDLGVRGEYLFGDRDGKEEVVAFNHNHRTWIVGGATISAKATEVTPINRTAFFIQYTEPPIKWFNTWRNN